MDSVEFAGLIWDRPMAWWGLLIPVLILIVSKRPLRPRVMATGAIGLWRRVLEGPGGGEGERPKIPLGLWWLCAGLIAAVLAMAGPRASGVGVIRTWTVLVDRSPASYLPVNHPEEKSRLAYGVELLEAEWRHRVREEDAVRWFDGYEWIDADSFPSAWSTAPRDPMSPPNWGRWDVHGCVWLCARAPLLEPSRASLCMSGGEAAPGAVAIDGRDRLDWSEGALVRVIDGAPLRSVRMEGVEGDLVSLVEVWAEERGLALNEEDSSGEEVLVISGEDAEPEISTPSGRGVISLGRGEGVLGNSDPAEFALFWSERLDRACLPAAGLSPVAGRAPIGNAMWLPGVPPDEGMDGGPPGRAWEGWLALLSCGLVAVALLCYPR